MSYSPIVANVDADNNILRRSEKKTKCVTHRCELLINQIQRYQRLWHNFVQTQFNIQLPRPGFALANMLSQIVYQRVLHNHINPYDIE